MTISEKIAQWHNRQGLFFSRRLKLLITRHTWGKSLNTPMHVTHPQIGGKATMLMNDMLTMPDVHKLLMAEAAQYRQEILELMLEGDVRQPIAVSTERELIKAQEAVLHLMKYGSRSLEPASRYEIEQLRLAEPRPKS